MKKLVFAMFCFTANVLMSSCTADSVVQTKNEKFTTPNKVPLPTTTDVKAGIDDTIPPRG